MGWWWWEWRKLGKFDHHIMNERTLNALLLFLDEFLPGESSERQGNEINISVYLYLRL